MKDLLEKVKAWFTLTALPWVKKEWLQLVNVFVLLVAYGKSEPGQGETILGLWLFVLAAYFGFKLFGIDKPFKKLFKKK